MEPQTYTGRFVSIILIGAGVLIAVFALALWGDAIGTLWLIMGAVCASLAMIGATFKVSASNKRLRKELESAEVDLELMNDLLSQAEDQLDELANSVPAAVFVCSPTGEILSCNQAAISQFDFSDPVGKTLIQVTLSMGLQQAVVNAEYEAEPKTQEIQTSHPSEKVMLATVWRPDQIAERVYLCLEDVTALKQLERVRSDFVSNASHELRTPMAAIRSMSETLLDMPELETKRREDYLKRIILEVDRLTNLSDDLLVLSEAESKKPGLEPIEFAATVRYAVQELENQAKDKGIRVNLNLPETVPVLGDDEQLVQVVLNLVSNAIRYSIDGEIRVNLHQRGSEAVLEVADTGIGIASEHLPRIFERFYRIDRARSRETGGTGLGLSIVRHIVESHGGRIEVESELNVGSTFRVFLPCP